MLNATSFDCFPSELINLIRPAESKFLSASSGFKLHSSMIRLLKLLIRLEIVIVLLQTQINLFTSRETASSS